MAGQTGWNEDRRVCGGMELNLFVSKRPPANESFPGHPSTLNSIQVVFRTQKIPYHYTKTNVTTNYLTS